MTRSDLVDHIKSKVSISDTACFCTRCKTKFEDSLYRPDLKRLTSRVKIRSDCFLKTLNACDQPSCKEKQTETNAEDFVACFDLDIENINMPPKLQLCQPHYSRLNYYESKVSCDICESTIKKGKYFCGKDYRKIQCFFGDIFETSHLNSDSVMCKPCYSRYRNAGGRSLDEILVTLEEYDYSSFESIDEIHERALHDVCTHLISLFKSDQAALFIMLYNEYVDKLPTLAKVYMSSACEILPHKKEWVMTGIKSIFSKSIEMHSTKAKKESKLLIYKGSNVHIVLHKALYRAYVHDLNCHKLQVSDKHANVETFVSKPNEDVTLMCAAVESNHRLKKQGKEFLNVYKEDPFQVANLNFNDIVKKIDPYIWNKVCLETMNEKEKAEFQKIDFTWDKHIFLDHKNAYSQKRFVRRLMHVLNKMFILNDMYNYPLHIINSSIIKQLSNSSKLLRLMNKEGNCVSNDTLSRFTEGVARNVRENCLKDFNPNSPIVVSIDNIDSLSPFATVRADSKNRCWHGTSVMAHQPLPLSDSLHPFENLTHGDNDFYPVKVFGDGRCFFRCIAVASHEGLCKSERNMFGQVEDGNLHSVETLLADKIRSMVCKVLEANYTFLCDLPIGQQKYYLEKRSGESYEGFRERIDDMKVTGTFAGPLEIAVAAFCLKTQICILQKKEGALKKVGTYPTHHFAENSPVCLVYSPDADGTPGHFDVLYKGHAHNHRLRNWDLPKAEMLELSPTGNINFFQNWVDHSNEQAKESYSNPSLYDALNVEYISSSMQPTKLNVLNSTSVPKKLSVRLSENKRTPESVPSVSYPETLFKTFIPQQIKVDLFKTSKAEMEDSMLASEIFVYSLERLTIKNKNMNIFLPNIKCKMSFENTDSCEKSRFAYLDVHDLKADSTETVRIVLDNLYRTFEISTKLNHLVVCGDIKTFEFIMRVKSECKHAMDWVIPYPGDWHILFNYQDVILKVFWDAGLKKVAKCTSLTTLPATGKFKKVHKFILQSYEALYMYQIDSFLKEYNASSGEGDTTMSSEEVQVALKNVLQELSNADANFTNVNNFISAQNDLKQQLIPSLFKEFDKWCTEMSEKYKTFAFWDRFLKKDVFAYVQLYLGMRSRNWEWRVSAVKHIATLMHAFDRVNYARWLPVHLSQMFALPEYVLDHFRKGGFCTSINGNSFSCIPFDEGHETLINRHTKKIIVKSTPESIGRIASTLPYQAKLVNNFESNLKISKTNLQQHDFAHSVILEEQANVFLYFEKWVESGIFINKEDCSLYQAFTNVHPEKGQVTDLLGYGLEGSTKMIEFVEGGIISPSSTKRFVIRKSLLKTFAPRQMTRRNMKYLEKEKQLITRCYIRTMALLRKGHKLPAANNLQFLETPRAICTKDGLPYKGRKSTVYTIHSTCQKMSD